LFSIYSPSRLFSPFLFLTRASESSFVNPFPILDVPYGVPGSALQLKFLFCLLPPVLVARLSPAMVGRISSVFFLFAILSKLSQPLVLFWTLSETDRLRVAFDLIFSIQALSGTRSLFLSLSGPWMLFSLFQSPFS